MEIAVFLMDSCSFLVIVMVWAASCYTQQWLLAARLKKRIKSHKKESNHVGTYLSLIHI